MQRGLRSWRKSRSSSWSVNKLDEKHEFQYHGSLNIYDGSNLIQTYDSWRCNKCGIIRICIRRPGKVEPEFLEDPSSPDEHWIILVCKAEKPRVETYSIKPGETIKHECVDGRVIEFGGDVKSEAKVAENHYLYRFEDVLDGFIDVSEDPPKVVIPKRS